jgi:hypothetical protein
VQLQQLSAAVLRCASLTTGHRLELWLWLHAAPHVAAGVLPQRLAGYEVLLDAGRPQLQALHAPCHSAQVQTATRWAVLTPQQAALLWAHGLSPSAQAWR